MSYIAALNLKNAVTVNRITTSNDGMGGVTTTTASAILSRAAIWQAGSSDTFLSDKMAAISTHVLACRASDDIEFNDEIVFAGDTYRVTGKPDEVANRGLVQLAALQLVE